MAIFKVEMEIIYAGDEIELKKTVTEALRSRYMKYKDISIEELDFINENTQSKMVAEK